MSQPHPNNYPGPQPQQPQYGTPQPAYVQPVNIDMQPMSSTSVQQQAITTMTHGLVVPLDKNSIEYKNRKKNENALVWYLAKIDKYLAYMRRQADRSSIEFCCGDQSQKPSQAAFGRTDVCFMEGFTCCCLTSCYTPWLRIHLYDEPGCTACCLGCFFHSCTSPGLLHDLYERIGVPPEQNSRCELWAGHCCCLQPCQMAKARTIMDYYRHKRWGYRLVTNPAHSIKRAFKGKQPFKLREKVPGNQYVVLYPALTEHTKPELAIAARQKRYPTASSIVMDPNTKRFIGTQSSGIATVITTTQQAPGPIMMQQPQIQPHPSGQPMTPHGQYPPQQHQPMQYQQQPGHYQQQPGQYQQQPGQYQQQHQQPMQQPQYQQQPQPQYQQHPGQYPQQPMQPGQYPQQPMQPGQYQQQYPQQNQYVQQPGQYHQQPTGYQPPHQSSQSSPPPQEKSLDKDSPPGYTQ